jgi:hypothetical protein
MSTQNKEVPSSVNQARGVYDMKNLLSSLIEIENSSSVRDIYDMTNLISELSAIENTPADQQKKPEPQTHASMPRYFPISHAHPLPKSFLF